jgi:hypothetical protein
MMALAPLLLVFWIDLLILSVVPLLGMALALVHAVMGTDALDVDFILTVFTDPKGRHFF